MNPFRINEVRFIWTCITQGLNMNVQNFIQPQSFFRLDDSRELADHHAFHQVMPVVLLKNHQKAILREQSPLLFSPFHLQPRYRLSACSPIVKSSCVLHTYSSFSFNYRQLSATRSFRPMNQNAASLAEGVSNC